jgi:hypothetical protein
MNPLHYQQAIESRARQDAITHYTANVSTSIAPLMKADIKIIKSLAIRFCVSEQLFSPGSPTHFVDLTVPSDFDRNRRFLLPKDRGKIGVFMRLTFKSDLMSSIPPDQHPFVATKTHLSEVSLLLCSACCTY